MSDTIPTSTPEGNEEDGYVNYCAILGVSDDAKPGEVRKEYRRRMKDLINEIARVEVTAARRSQYLLDMAKLNAALCVLRDTQERELYWNERAALIDLEARWRNAVSQGDSEGAEALGREFDRRVRTWLSKYVEDMMLAAGRDKECVEASNWDRAHERHATRLLREFRHRQFRLIVHRLPFSDIVPPTIDWAEREATAAMLLGSGS